MANDKKRGLKEGVKEFFKEFKSIGDPEARHSASSIKKEPVSTTALLLIYIIGSVLLIYWGILLGAVWLPGSSFADVWNNFVKFVIHEHHFLVGFTSATPKFVFALWGFFTIFFLMEMTKYRHPFAGEEYGKAHWGNAKSFTEEFADHDEKNLVKVNCGNIKIENPPVVNTKNYWIAEGVYVSTENKKTSNLNMLVIGPPGSGKTFRLAKPILSSLCGSFLVTDPKGELYQQTGQYFEDNGYEVMVMNVESEDSMPMSIHFNPFRYIRNESDIMTIAGILMKATASPDSSSGGNDAFFEQSAEVLLTSLLYLIHYFYPVEKQTWQTFVELLDSTAVHTNAQNQIDNTDEHCIFMRMKKADDEWADNELNTAHTAHFPGFVEVDKFYHGASETTSSIVASLDAHCRYMKLKCVVDLLSEDQIHIGDSFAYCKNKDRNNKDPMKRILYIVTSEDKRYFDWIVSMLYSLFFDELYHLTGTDPSLHLALKEHLTFLMDEFYNVTLPDSFIAKLSTMRSRNMSAIVIVQNLIQLKDKFPKNDLDKNLIGNCAIIDVIGAPDLDSCEYLSKHFGTMTIRKATESESKDYKGSSSKSEDVMQKSLLSTDDIMGMKPDGKCAIFVKGADPLMEEKCKLENTELIKLLCRKEPYDPIAKRQAKIEVARLKSSVDLDKKDSIVVSGNELLDSVEDEINALDLVVKAFNLSDLFNKDEKEKEDYSKSSRFDQEVNYFEDLHKITTLNINDFREDIPDLKSLSGEEKLNMQEKLKKRNIKISSLQKSGYSVEQIYLLKPFIVREDFSYENIVGMFPLEILHNDMIGEIKEQYGME